MALWIANAGLSITRFYFLLNLLNQLSNEQWPSYNNYVYSPDFMWNGGITFDSKGQEKAIPSACAAGPSGQLPVFDFVVVGSGPGGSTVASRLAKAFPKRTVVLAEAGPEASVNVVSPGMFSFGMKIEGTQAYHANPSPNYGKAFVNGIKLDVGRALGGTSNVNAMVYLCGTDRDYDHIANITGDYSWKYQNMLPHIRSVMSMKDETLTKNPKCAGFYGTEGELKVDRYDSDEVPVIGLLQYAAAVAGFENVEDFNCGKWTGFIRLRGTVYKGERQSAANAFLAPLKNQKNLMILRNAVVDNVITEKKDNGKAKVKGVKVVTNIPECPSFELRAKREVILAAGAFNTPLVLQRSGIGREENLAPFNIPQKLDLNVGHNYREHVLSVHVISLPSEPISDAQMDQIVGNYFFNRTGQFAYASSADIDGFLNVDDPKSKHPNIQWPFFTFAKQQREFRHIMEYTLELKPEFVDQLEAINNRSALILTLNVLLKPKSSGFVGLRSTNPFDEPNIDANFLAEADDLRVLTKGLRRLQDFVNSPVMKAANATFDRIFVDECDQGTVFDSDAYWKCYFSYFTQTLWHPSGTTRIGKKGDPNAVVDNRLKVIGVIGKPDLRVTDASTFPDEMACNTQCPVYSIAAKAAAMIIEDNQ